MRRIVLPLITAFAISSLLLGACAAPKPTPAPTAAQKPTAAPTPAKPTPLTSVTPVEPIKLKFSITSGPQHHISQNVNTPWLKELETASGGRIKTEAYFGAVLGPENEQYDMVVKGIADLAFVNTPLFPGRFNLTNIMQLPFSFRTSAEASEAIWQLLPKHLATEFKEVHVAWLGCTSPYQILTSKKPIRKLEDFKGLTIRSPGGRVTSAMQVLGITPVSVTSPELYTSVERGVVDGYAFPIASVLSFKLEEVTKYLIELGLGTTPIGVVMNKKTWDNLPPDLQKLVTEVTEKYRKKVGASYDGADTVGKEQMIKKGVEVITFAPEEMNRIRDKVMPVWDQWVKDVEAQGLPGRALMDDFKKMLEKR